jgi:4-oxalocrotonate tautomerase
LPHVIVKLWPGKTETQKQELAKAITKDVMQTLGYAEASVSVSLEQIDAARWREEVYLPDIVGQPDRLYKKPGYTM